MTAHNCTFPEVTIETGDFGEGDPLKPGMEVLTPCPDCGETPLDHLGFMTARQQEMTDALLSARPIMPLFHWSPRARRKQILRYGLRPGMRATTSSGDGWIAPCVCFADSPSWAWALTLDGRGHDGEWDLWQTSVDRLTDPLVLASDTRMSGLYEVRTESRVFKRDLWLVGSRTR